MKQTIRSVDPISLGKVLGILYLGIGLIAGAIVSLVSVLGAFGSLAGGGGRGAFGFLFGAGAIILLPVFYGVIGLIGGIIAGFIFNIATKVTGGLVIELD